MAIKVRCTGCKRVFNVPDAANGKVIRCPKCETKFRVRPAPSQKAQKSRRAAEPKTEEDELAGLDLSQLEDTSVRVCPKCGTEVTEEDTECPNCRIDLATGVMSDATRRKLARRGPDPNLYYKTVWKDSWRFTMANKKLAFRTIAYITISVILTLGCGFMVTWCRNMPPRVFWGSLAVISFLVTPGWLIHLNVEIIRAAVDQRKRLPRINFDFFLSTALGIKLLSWEVAFLVQMIVGVVGVVLLVMNQVMIGGILLGVGVLLTVPLLPLAMAHMAMPVTYPSWLAHKMLGVFVNMPGQTIYWCIVLFVTSLPMLAAAGAAGAVSGRGVVQVVDTVQSNMQLPPPAEGAKDSGRKPVDWKPLIAPGIALIINQFLFGFIALFNMRSNALLVHYCGRRMDLITIKKETKYRPKSAAGERKYLGPEHFRSMRLAPIRWGVKLQLIGLGLFVFGAMGSGAAVGVHNEVLAVGAITCVVLAALTAGVGMLLFLGCPPETGAAPFIWGAFALELISIGARIGVRFAPQELLPVLLLMGTSAVTGIAAFSVFMTFLERLSFSIARDDIAARARLIRNLYLSTVFWIIMLTLAGLFLHNPVAFFGAIGLGALICLVCMVTSIVLYIMLLGGLSAAFEEIRRKQARLARAEEDLDDVDLDDMD